MRGRPKKDQSERLNKMIELRNSGKTLQEIGDMFGISRERARVILSEVGVSKPARPPRYATKFSGILWGEKIKALEVGESFIFDGRITTSMPDAIKRSAKRIGMKVQVYKFHSGRIRVTRFC